MATERSWQNILPLFVSTPKSRVRLRYPVSKISKMMHVPTAMINSMMVNSDRFISAPSHFKQYETIRVMQNAPILCDPNGPNGCPACEGL
jgi:hypothetical protein